MCEHCKAQLSWKACVCIILGLYTCMCMSATCEVLQLYKMALQTLVSMLFCLHSFLPIKEGRKKNLGSGWYISHLKRLIVFQWKHRPQQNITHEMLLRTSPMRCAVCITHEMCCVHHSLDVAVCITHEMCCVHHSWDVAVCITHEMLLCASLMRCAVCITHVLCASLMRCAVCITHEMLLCASLMRCAVCITHEILLCASLMRCCCVHHSWDLAVCIHEMFLCAKHHSRVFAVYMQVWPVWSVCFAPQPRRSCLRRHS
jgi:hypothetical protein